ncbi:MAG: adenylosuccinate lyase [Pseudomonadota bacterium]
MKFKTIAIAAAISVLPTLSLAMGCSSGHKEQQAMSCAAGTTYDSATNTCMPVST